MQKFLLIKIHALSKKKKKKSFENTIRPVE